MLLALGIRWLSSHDPGMGAFTIGAHDNVSIETEAKKKIAEEYCVIFRVTTSLITSNNIRLIMMKLDLNVFF